MILESICQHCDQRLSPTAQACDRCGAPGSTAILRAPQLEPGYRLYQNAWTGFAVLYPEDWSAHALKPNGVRFASPDQQAELELSLLPAQTLIDAPQHVDLVMRSLPGHSATLKQGSTPEHAQAHFHGPQWEGLLSVHLTPRGGTLGLARRRPGCPLPLEAPFTSMLGSLTAILPIPRERWTDPNEGSFEVETPTGWQRQAAIVPPAGGQGMRQPVARITAHPGFRGDPGGQIFIALEPEYRDFIHGPPPAPRPAQEGFLQKLGRMAQEFDRAMTASMGGVVCPFQGMGPALELFFWPHWQRTMPGVQLLGYDDHGAPDSGDARLLLPGDVVRVVHLTGVALPNMGMGPRWMGGHAYYYQAPAALMGKLEPIFQGIAASFKQSPDWRQRELGMANQQFQQVSFLQQQQSQQWMAQSQALHQQRMNDIAMQGMAHQQITANQQAMSDMVMQGWQSSHNSSDFVQHQSINAVNERSDFRNPTSGELHNLSIHYQNYWDTGQDLIVGSNVSLQPPPSWTPLENWDHGGR